jgi:MraZ protein
MLRGNIPATIDSKGRIKVPNSFRKYIEETYGRECFVTSTSGDFVRVYPLSVWEEKEKELAEEREKKPVLARVLNLVNYYGQVTAIDPQGRLLIHPLLRQRAGLDGTVAVLGKQTHLDIWNREKFETRFEGRPFTDEENNTVASHLGY